MQITHDSGHSRRDITLPTVNVLDPLRSIISFKSYISSLFGGLIQVAQDAASTAEESTKAVRSLLVFVVDSTKTKVETLVNQTVADIWKAVNKSAIGTAMRLKQCGQKGIQTVAVDAFNTGKYI